ncbi:hypothetical protein HZH66_007693 [Vespula vulgaris]|uniref:Uncharacterized protein n=1 Tax=Vespula vulgaris TaxID=7454 RepID=A0A834N4D3_VESVU|nr:hypothetical protein HZH66_007693 [Vespula vulgaris]
MLRSASSPISQLTLAEEESRDVETRVESTRVAELWNYFKAACVIACTQYLASAPNGSPESDVWCRLETVRETVIQYISKLNSAQESEMEEGNKRRGKVGRMQ